MLYRCEISKHSMGPLIAEAAHKIQMAVISNSWEKYDKNICFQRKDEQL